MEGGRRRQHVHAYCTRTHAAPFLLGIAPSTEPAASRGYKHAGHTAHMVETIDVQTASSRGDIMVYMACQSAEMLQETLNFVEQEKAVRTRQKCTFLSLLYIICR